MKIIVNPMQKSRLETSLFLFSQNSPTSAALLKFIQTKDFTLETLSLFCVFDQKNLIFHSHFKNFYFSQKSIFKYLAEDILTYIYPDIIVDPFKQILEVSSYYPSLELLSNSQDIIVLYDFLFTNNLLKQSIKSFPDLFQIFLQKNNINLQHIEIQKEGLVNKIQVQKLDQKLINLLNFDPIIYLLTYANVQLQLNYPFPQFWQYAPPNRRNSKIIDSSLENQPYKLERSFRNYFGLLPILYTQFRDVNTLDNFHKSQNDLEVEGMKCEHLNYFHLIFSLFNESQREIVINKLQFSLLNDLIFEDFPGIPQLTDLDEVFELNEYIIQDGQQQETLEEAIIVLLNMELEELLDLDTDQDFINSHFFNSFNVVFTHFSMLEQSQIAQLRDKFFTILASQATLSSIQIHFLLSAPHILIILIFKFMRESFNLKLPVSLTLCYQIQNQIQFFIPIFSENSHVRSTVLNCLKDEVLAFSGLEININKGLTSKQMSWISNEIDSKIQSFYQFEETNENIQLALLLSQRLSFQRFPNFIFGKHEIQDIIMQKILPQSNTEIIYHNMLNFSFRNFIKWTKNIEIFNYFQCNYTAPLTSTANFHRMLTIFNDFIKKEWKIEFKAKAGILSFANGILNMQKDKNLTQKTTNLYIEILVKYGEGMKSQNLCNIYGHVLQKLALRDMGENNGNYFNLMKIFNFNKFAPETVNLEDILRFSGSVLLTSENAKTLLIYINIYVKQQKLNSELLIIYQNILNVIIKLKMQFFNFYGEILDIINNIHQNIEFCVHQIPKQLTIDIILIYKLVFQELYFQAKSSSQQAIYCDIFVFLFEKDRNFVISENCISTRSTQRGKFTAKFAEFCAENLNFQIFEKFLTFKYFKTIFREFKNEKIFLEFLYQIIQQQQYQKTSWTIYENFIKFQAPETISRFAQELLKLGIDELDINGIDVLISIFRAQNNTDFYVRKIVVPHNFVFDAIMKYFTVSEVEKSQILILASLVIQRSDLTNELLLNCKKVTLNLNFHSSKTDNVTLAFLCHVRNVMDAGDERRSEVLPAALMRCVKAMREGGE
eukprot:EST48867.1 Hypothetical protein SS50377_10968 [Spironucleus salmonicida]